MYRGFGRFPYGDYSSEDDHDDGVYVRRFPHPGGRHIVDLTTAPAAHLRGISYNWVRQMLYEAACVERIKHRQLGASTDFRGHAEDLLWLEFTGVDAEFYASAKEWTAKNCHKTVYHDSENLRWMDYDYSPPSPPLTKLESLAKDVRTAVERQQQPTQPLKQAPRASNLRPDRIQSLRRTALAAEVPIISSRKRSFDAFLEVLNDADGEEKSHTRDIGVQTDLGHDSRNLVDVVSEQCDDIKRHLRRMNHHQARATLHYTQDLMLENVEVACDVLSKHHKDQMRQSVEEHLRTGFALGRHERFQHRDFTDEEWERLAQVGNN